MKTATKNCFLRSEPLAFAEATIMKNNLPIDNPSRLGRRLLQSGLRPFVAEDFVEALLGLDE